MKRRHICVLGGSGFVGTHLVNRLADAGHKVTVLSRHPQRQRHLLVLPTVQVVAADVFNERDLDRCFAAADTVINLIGILHSSARASFARVHVELARKVAAACRRNGVRRLLHMSALNADEARGASAYLRSKGEAENLAHALHDVAVTSFRPSVIFGAGDFFFNRFATLLRLSPGMLPLACPNARFAPVYVGDVVAVMEASIDMQESYGRRYELCGPKRYSLRELVEYTAQVVAIKRRVLPLNEAWSRLLASVLERLPGKALTRDNLDSMKVDSVCEGAFPALFGVTPAAVEAVVPTYLNARGQGDRFDRLRKLARHE